MKFYFKLEKVGTLKYWLGKRRVNLETWLEEDLRCTEERFCSLHHIFFGMSPMKVLYYKWWKYFNYRLVIFIVKENPGMLKLELTVSAQAGEKKGERD